MNPFFLAWMVWLLVWLVLWAWSKRARRREKAWTWSLHVVPLMLAVVLISPRSLPWWFLEAPGVPYQPAFHGVGLALTLGGLALSVWARLSLGRNWSASVRVKIGHQLVRHGPYRVVRHPIYTGLLLASAGSALAWDPWRGVLAVLLVLAGFIYKLRLEERWMTETFGDGYRDDRRHTWALLPFIY